MEQPGLEVPRLYTLILYEGDGDFLVRTDGLPDPSPTVVVVSAAAYYSMDDVPQKLERMPSNR